MDVLGIKASEARHIVDPYLGTQKVDDGTANLQRLVKRYLARTGKKQVAAESLPLSEPREQVQEILFDVE